MKKNRFALCIDSSGLKGENHNTEIQIGKVFLINAESEGFYNLKGFPSHVCYYTNRFIKLNEKQANSKLVKLMKDI